MSNRGVSTSIHAGNHYENFPVASWLLPARLRRPVLSLYRFARAADDIADEGTANADERLSKLHQLRSGLLAPGDLSPYQVKREPLTQLGIDLGQQLALCGLSPEPAERLLSAFSYDARFSPFDDEEALLSYCSCSANPVGEMVLGFAGAGWPVPPDLLSASNAICSGLQLVNFAQDLHEDLARGRPTLPRTVWPKEWGWSHGAFSSAGDIGHPEKIRVSVWLAERGLERLREGERLIPLIRARLPHHAWRLALEIAVTVRGGSAVGRLIQRRPLLPWKRSVRLGLLDFLGLIPLSLALLFKPIR